MRAAFAIILGALICGVLAAPATAAPYTVWSCRDAVGAPLPATAWIPGGNAGERTDTCGSGGSLAVTLSSGDTAQGLISGYRFDVPPGVTLTGYTASITAATDAGYVAGLGQGDELAVPNVIQGCYNGDACTYAAEETVPVLLGGLALMAACSSALPACEPAADPPVRAALLWSAVELDDPSAPAVGPLGGTVAAGSPASGLRTVVADVSDAGSGIRRTELLVDGAVVDSQDGPGACIPPYTVADPCPRSARTTFVLDTTTLAEGSHTVAARAYDAAMSTAESAPLAVAVVHATTPPPPTPPVVVQDPPAPQPAAVRLRVPERMRLPASQRVTGTVLGAGGTPRAGVRVSFQRRPFGGGEDDWRDLRSSAVSDAAGRFRVPVPPVSAEVRALVRSTAYAATPAIVGFVGRLKATIRAAGRTLRNGDRLTLRGRLRNAGGAGADRTVLIQSRVRGSWRAVDSVQSGSRGRITWRYRFTNTRRTARYRFRFVVPPAKRLPWKRLVTRQVSVLVRAG